MNKDIILSVDSQCLQDPKLIQLEKAHFNLPWMHVFTDAYKLREFVRDNKESFEIYIAANDDIESINLAATLKKDRRDCVVCLVSYDLSGSLQSRARAANIDNVVTIESLRERVLAKKEKENSDDNFAANKIPQSVNYKAREKNAFVLSVISASGGSGKSTISSLCATLCQASGLKTLIIDADFQLGEIPTLFRQKNVLHIDELIDNRGAVVKLKPKNTTPAILAAPSLPELSEKVIEDFPAILESLKPLFDVIVVNTGSFWNELQAILLEHDSKSLFLIDQRASSLQSTKKILSLCERCGIATSSIIFALNKCSKNSLFTSMDVSCVLDGANVAEITDGGFVVDECCTIGNLVELIKQKNICAVSLWAIIENFLPKTYQTNQNVTLRKSKKQKWYSGIIKRRSA